MRERRSPRHSSSWNDISFPAVTHYAFLRDPKSGIKAGKRRKKKRRSAFSLTIAARATLPSVACAPFCSYCSPPRIISSFADSIAILRLSFLTFDYDIFRETLRARSVPRVPSARAQFADRCRPIVLSSSTYERGVIVSCHLKTIKENSSSSPSRRGRINFGQNDISPRTEGGGS